MRTGSGRAVMFQGTSSHVGKSVVTTALCRILKQDGFRVAPFKSQNMSNNSCITIEGGEIGRAQWVQAEAAGVSPSVIMNPVLIKPKADSMAQVVFLGRPAGDFDAGQYRLEFTQIAIPVIGDCLDKLLTTYDAVVIEGAGSPAEINLKDREIVNMRVAKMANSPVILVADIDRGGVFASLVGTLELLDPDERELVRGFVINKFRGSKALLEPGLKWLEDKTGVPVLGVLPYMQNHDIPDEDAVSVEENSKTQAADPDDLHIAVIRLPRISNFTDFESLQGAGVYVRYATTPGELDSADCVILPGTKNTIVDLEWLRSNGLAAKIVDLSGKVPVMGVCGGYQMLGRVLHDPLGTEASRGRYDGLGLLDIETTFGQDKTTTLSTGEVANACPYLPAEGTTLSGYEIHTGRTDLGPRDRPFLRVLVRDGNDAMCSTAPYDGAISPDGMVMGTYFHGLFENGIVRKAFLDYLCHKKGVSLSGRSVKLTDAAQQRQEAYDRLAATVRANLDVDKLYGIMGIR